MIKILISDTHYGVKQNSITWLNKQMDFIYQQLIPYIDKVVSESHDSVRLYHLGDVFDSRSAISPLVASRVRKMFEDLCEKCDQVVVIGGNHDYYSPNDDSINSLNMVLPETNRMSAEIVVKNTLKFGEDLFVPWYEYDKIDKLKDILSKYKDIKNIFVHADLPHIDDVHREMFKNYNVYSGHIHTPEMTGNLHTLGSTYALTFADCNADRGFYTLEEDKLTFHPNNYSIRFWRLYDSQIFKDLNYINKDDYVELYISQANLINTQYTDRLKYVSKLAHNTVVVPISDKSVSESVESFDSYNIEEMCRENIPDYLLDKFNQIISELNQTING